MIKENVLVVLEHDLDKPYTPPYRYQAWPKAIFRLGEERGCADQATYELLKADGWQTREDRDAALADVPKSKGKKE